MATHNFKFAQLQPFSLAGAGAVAGATSITLKSMTDIDGNALSMSSDFGTIGFGTLEPGSGTQEEQICFTGLVNNSNGTVTLTGVSSVAFVYPYTQTSGLAKTHAGSVTFVISNTAGFYDQQVSKDDDATITGKYTFPGGGNANAPVSGTVYAAPTDDLEYASKKYVDTVAISGAPDANTTTKGIVQIATQAQVDAGTATGSTGASLVPTPALARSKLLSDYVVDTGAADAYVITPSPAISAYATGQIFSFKATHDNTTTSTLNVNAKGAVTIKKNGGANNLVAGDILNGQIVMVEYDGTNFQLINSTAEVKLGQTGKEIYAADSVGTDSYAVTLVPAIAAYTTGMVINFKAGTSNTGASTLAVNGLSAITIKKLGGQADTATGDIIAGQIITVVYDGTNFQMQSQTSTGSYAFGVVSDLNTSSVANNDVSVSLSFTPRLIKLYLFLQGHDAATSTNAYYGIKGIALFNGTSVSQYVPIWGILDGQGSQLSGDDGTPTAVTALINDTATVPTLSAGSAGGGSPNGAIKVTLTINSVSSSGFTIRRATTANGTPGIARAKISYEAWA